MERERLGFAGCGATGVMYGPVLKYLWRGVATAFMDPDRGGIFQDHGSHTADLCRWWSGEIEVASGEINILVDGAEVEDQAVAAFRHEGGTLSLHYQSNMAHKPLNEYYLIDGSKASLEIQFGPAWSYTSTESFRMTLYRRGRHAEDITWYNESNLDIELQRHGRCLKELEHFCEYVQEGREPRTTGEEGLRGGFGRISLLVQGRKGASAPLRGPGPGGDILLLP
ncbi:MAG TPA: hypothetical protein EYP17_12405 [Candidatus Latescibacteria bacterium]|nr:hypothetical protein [Candidatus Latescibacterota bacterium]